MKPIYACKKGNLDKKIALFFLVSGSVLLIINVVSYFGFLGGGQISTSNFYRQIVSNVLLILFGGIKYVFNCTKYFVAFDEDKLKFRTSKNKLTEIYYKDIESHDIHIFEIVFHLKNGKTITLNLDVFAYEQIRKVKEEMVKRL